MTPPRRLPRGSRQAGIALLLAVWILALLAVIGGEFMASGRVRAAAERNRRDDLRGLALALAGYRAALAALDDKLAGLSRDGDGVLQLHYSDGKEEPALAEEVALGDGSYSWRIEDEGGLFWLNDPNLRRRRHLLANLLQQCGLGPGVERDTVVDSILDWVDPKGFPLLNGAEEEYYNGLDPPYSCKDGKFDVVEELLLVRGVTPGLFAGSEIEGEKKPGLRELVTTRGRPIDGINLATAPQPVLDALGKPRQARPQIPEQFAIVATGHPGGGAPARSLRAGVLRKVSNSGPSFTLVYWNDRYLLE